MVGKWLKLVCYMLVLITSEVKACKDSSKVNVTFIKDAVAKGAVCLDGSPGAYYFAPGFGDGANNWIVFLPGGGWCRTKDGCLYRSGTPSGSTKDAPATKTLPSIQTSNQSINPDFYNWNKVLIRYCDGASFMADVEAVDVETKLHFRGRRIFSTVIEELIATRRMGNAVNALLVGDSAGGLATILNCHRFSSFLSMACNVKCVSDSGFFIHAQDLPGADYRENYFANVTAFHGLANFLPESCTSRRAPGLCLFPEYVVDDIQTPLFLLNSDFDRYQINTNLKPNPPDDVGWSNCTQNFVSLQECSTTQLHLIKDFQTAFLETLEGLNYIRSRGIFINSCYIHDFISQPCNWQGIPMLGNKTIAEVVGNWYMNRSNVQLIDSQNPYPIDCHDLLIG